MRRRRFLRTVFLSAALSLGCSDQSSADVASLTLHFRNPNGTLSPTITAEIVSTPVARNIGLMYRKEMPATSGMLFVFPDLADRSFWMKNTYLELDIIYIDDKASVVSIAERAKPQTTESRPSAKPARYVLEVLGGKSKEWGIGAGSVVEFDSPPPAATQ